MDATPEPCTACNKKPAITRDGRLLCGKCLKAIIASETPMVGCYRGMTRTRDHKQDNADPGPWFDNAVRCLEGD